ncbi:hypothetical protein GPECTOR_1g908 [Gonium pectorale]|uniref:OPA3-like protein n=1 Tax=Gonium pectorale TaxID=33097 RepID=A0A150H4R2_GONPE|nr:hypothetical protein GPECTOR_1g908 [Gonium pectorale]|eukprot:KXZ57005.1 hypothetical protein GPECTOR_1g908 [Gonium pectorale]
MAALVFKLGALVLKQLAKPLGARFEKWVMNHPQARRGVISAAQVVHRWEVYITRGAEGKEGKAFVGAMTEEKSVELASKLASEGFVLGVGTLIVLFEYDRNRRKEIEKKRKEDAERQAILDQASRERERLRTENVEQQELIAELMGRVERLEALVTGAQQQQQQQQKKKPAMWGGFLGPRALDP